MKFILGKKLEMTQIYQDNGTVIPVTAVLANPNTIIQIKSEAGKDGYNAVVVGWGTDKKLGKTKAGQLKGLSPVKKMKEFRADKEDIEKLKRGDVITVEVFAEGDEVKVTGTSKGKGFQGVVKRHGFHGSPKTHGHKDQERMPGSIGAGGVQRVFKGVKMAGRMGGDQVTVSGLKVIAIDLEKNILYIKGAVPGARNSEIAIYGNGVMEIKESAPIVEEVATEVVAENVSKNESINNIESENTVNEENPVIAETDVIENNQISSDESVAVVEANETPEKAEVENTPAVEQTTETVETEVADEADSAKQE